MDGLSHLSFCLRNYIHTASSLSFWRGIISQRCFLELPSTGMV
nr:hypothetical protein Iba_scaffold36607CG0010 [Ipomoea batatas]GME01540.1 hypothetical protein Iba_scaffold557120CG0010 [Ipomoea batatas]